ncbi:MAG: PilZ domain-containing protein [Proteobacteria bacterium]|nr:PilZ domain-containing protein [Pseudomonadota bacterium]
MSGEANPVIRENERLPITLRVNFNTEMDFLNAQAKNISASGMFIHTLHPLPEGVELNIHFEIPEVSMDFATKAKIVWTATFDQTFDEEEAGMGIEFLNLGRKQSKILQNYIETKMIKKRKISTG